VRKIAELRGIDAAPEAFVCLCDGETRCGGETSVFLTGNVVVFVWKGGSMPILTPFLADEARL